MGCHRALARSRPRRAPDGRALREPGCDDAPADAGGNNVYDVVVQVSDGTHTDTQAIAVTVNNLDEVAPSFSSAASVSVNENVAANSLVYTAAAIDTDFNAPATANSSTLCTAGFFF